MAHFFPFHLAMARKLPFRDTWHNIGLDLAGCAPKPQFHILQNLKVVGIQVKFKQLNCNALFNCIILKPLSKSAQDLYSSPPVVIIDGLEWYGTFEGWKEFLHVLSQWCMLPPQFKLIVISRDKENISTALDPISCLIDLTSKTFITESHKDIQLFLCHQFSEIEKCHPDLFPGSPGRVIVEDLTKEVAGLFVQTKAIINFICKRDLRSRLDTVIIRTVMPKMKTLYSCILEKSCYENSTFICFNSHYYPW